MDTAGIEAVLFVAAGTDDAPVGVGVGIASSVGVAESPLPPHAARYAESPSTTKSRMAPTSPRRERRTRITANLMIEPG
jgi:hypothetical protein